MLLDLAKPKKRTAISLTPLIDVVFILLLFFMLSSTFMQWRQIQLSAPSTADTDVTETITVTLLNNMGEFEINNKQFTADSDVLLSAEIGQQADAVYVLKVEPGVKTQAMISLLDQLKQAGAAQVSLSGIMQ